MKKFITFLQVCEGGLYLTLKFGIHLELTFKKGKSMRKVVSALAALM